MSSHVVRRPAGGIRGSICVPGDKSIAHRAVMLGCLAKGTTRISNFPRHNDSQATIGVFKQLGIRIEESSNSCGRITVYGRGLYGLRASAKPLMAHESGTTLRLLAGIVSGQPFTSTITAAAGLLRRPMSRITVPLRRMGARIVARHVKGANEEYPPLAIRGGQLKPITYTLPVASAQVKSALLLAGLYAGGPTVIIEPAVTRDHTERMLRMFGAQISVRGRMVRLVPGKELVCSARRITIPGDISSAAFFIVAALIVPGSRVVLKNVSLNPTRCGVLHVLKRMGGSIRIVNRTGNTGGEPAGDIIVESSRLRSTVVRAEEVPVLVDEVPVLMIAASVARGTTVFEGVGELRVKETDRVHSMTSNLKRLGVTAGSYTHGSRLCLSVQGVDMLTGSTVSGFNDHRTAMSMAVAGLAASGKTTITGVECIAKSFPGFFKVLASLQ